MECSQSLRVKYKNASLYVIGGWGSNSSDVIVNSPKLLIYLIRLLKKRI